MKETSSKKLNVLFLVTASIREDGSIYYPSFMRSQIESLEPVLGKAIVLPLTGNTSPVAIRKSVGEAKALIRDHNIDVVHPLYGSMTAFIADMARGNKPMVVSFCGDDLLGSRNTGIMWTVRNKLMTGFSQKAASSAKAIIVKSQNLLNALSGNNQSKALIIANGVNLDRFSLYDQKEARAKLGWGEEEKVVLFNPSSGANQPVKNLPLAREAMKVVSGRINARMELIRDKTPQEVVQMMNAADALVVTSLHEGSPNIVKEAMAVNLPVVTVNCGDVKERLTGITNSFVVDSYEAKDIADALCNVLERNSRSDGRDQLEKQGLSMQAVRDRILAIYSQLTQTA